MKPMIGYVRMMEHEGLAPVGYKWCYATYTDEATGKKPEKSEPIENLSDFFLNSWIGKKIHLSTNGKIRCVDCGKFTSKSFNQGSCFQCFSTKACNDLCIMRPETCHHHKGTCREPEWGDTNCFKKHTVYFANSSGLKVGITKENPVSNRWVDQGARFAVPLMEVESRREAGIIENYLSGFLPDKTTWQKMVAGDPPEMDLKKEKEKFLRHLEKQSFEMEMKTGKKKEIAWKSDLSEKIVEIQYPIVSFPKKIKSYKLDESNPIEDILVGIKGQYLLFENGVINIRSYSGHQTSLYAL